jgi:hypothetical protein
LQEIENFDVLAPFRTLYPSPIQLWRHPSCGPATVSALSNLSPLRSFVLLRERLGEAVRLLSALSNDLTPCAKSMSISCVSFILAKGSHCGRAAEFCAELAEDLSKSPAVPGDFQELAEAASEPLRALASGELKNELI